MNSKLFLLAGVMALFVLTSGCLSQTATETGTANVGTEDLTTLTETVETVNAHFLVIKDSETITDKTVEVEKGTNAFYAMLDALGEENVSFQEYAGLGAFITAINGIAGDEENYWALHVNGEEAELGISSYTLEEETEIKWVYTALSDFGSTEAE